MSSKTPSDLSAPTDDPGSDRALIARIAAHTSWANTSDRSARTAPGRAAARAAMLDRFEREIDPDGTMSPAERALRAESARRAYFSRLALRSAQARRRRAGRDTDGAA
ncbi:hypothetical protein ACQP04_09905 [Pseudonocardia halophobica]|uniref:hypothetical protein n=1 Tax=Pseudonocardia halophobica TaxID=29401 RepID=UPI003D91FAD5